MTTSQLTLALVAALLCHAEISRAAEAKTNAPARCSPGRLGEVAPRLPCGAEAKTNAPARSCCAARENAGFVPVYTGKSLYQVESKWTTDGGKAIQLGDLAGKPQVVLMFYSKCIAACPILRNDLKRISAALTPEQRAQIGFTLVSFDTERDTPAVLAQYRQAWDLPGKNWTLLSGNRDDTLELALLLGVKYKKDAAGQFAHSNLITVLNANGEIVHQQIGLNEDISQTVQTLVKLLKN